MSGVGELTVAQLAQLSSVTAFAQFAKRLLVVDYSGFVDQLYADLDAVINRILQSRHHRQDDGEDRTTIDIVDQLQARGYDARHDDDHGGHADITVIHPDGYRWYAEAKIHSSYEKLKDGFDQLCTRYMPGTPNADQGAELIYIFNVDATAVVTKWNETLSAAGYNELVLSVCPTWHGLGFVSTHTHAGSGRPVRVRHTGIALHHAPAA